MNVFLIKVGMQYYSSNRSLVPLEKAKIYSTLAGAKSAATSARNFLRWENKEQLATDVKIIVMYLDIESAREV